MTLVIRPEKLNLKKPSSSILNPSNIGEWNLKKNFNCKKN